MKYNLVIFDFDGTLADSFSWFIGVMDEVIVKFHTRSIDKDSLESLRDSTPDAIFKEIGLPFWKIPFIANYMRKRMAEDISQIQLFNGISDLLKKLSARGITLAIVSSNSYHNISEVLNQEIASLISYYECGTSIYGKKSKLKKLLKKSGFNPQESILIGDEIRDSNAAGSVNIAFGAVSWGYNSFKSLKECTPAIFFERVEEIFEKIV